MILRVVRNMGEYGQLVSKRQSVSILIYPRHGEWSIQYDQVFYVLK